MLPHNDDLDAVREGLRRLNAERMCEWLLDENADLRARIAVLETEARQHARWTDESGVVRCDDCDLDAGRGRSA